MSEKRAKMRKSSAQLSLKEQLLGVQTEEDLLIEKRDVPVTIRMNPKVLELLDALIELNIFESRSEAITAMVEAMISSKYKTFHSLKSQADDLKRRREEAKEMASRVIRGDVE
ncbi:MAG: ribbon-helix-helix domain-containing protein [Candidatus Thorarchaeota archaeon]